MDAFDRALDAFQEIFPDPVIFGKHGGASHGASDGTAGVQWNFWVKSGTEETYLSINFEGMKYKDWPISSFLQSELQNPQLLLFRPETHEGIDPIVRFCRDAWQAQARIPIHEAEIGHVAPLSQLTENTWRATLKETLACLDETKSYRGRAKQQVTRVKDDLKVEMWVSPHLNILVKLWDAPPSSHSAAYEAMKNAIKQLNPIYEYIRTQAGNGAKINKSKDKAEFSSITDAANHALRFSRKGTPTHKYLTGLASMANHEPGGKYTVTPLRFVWWGDSGERLVRFQLSSAKLTLVVSNKLLIGVQTPVGAEPHTKNVSMTDCFTSEDNEIDELLRIFTQR